MTSRELLPLDKNPVIEAYKKDVDRALIRENLKLTHEQRVLQLMELVRLYEEAQRAGKAMRAQAARAQHGS